MEKKDKISLEEATMRALLGELDKPEDDVEGIVDGVMVVTDPDITPEEYEEVIEKAQEIIEDTPEGEVPFNEEYVGEYLMSCPICGTTFTSKDVLNVGDSCPVCTEIPEQGFVLQGQIATQTDVELQNDIKDAEEAVDEELEEVIPEEEQEQEEEELLASEEPRQADNKLEENKEIKEEGFYNLYDSYSALYGIEKYTPNELICFLDELKNMHRISDKDYKVLTKFANDYKALIDNCGYESPLVESEDKLEESKKLTEDSYNKGIFNEIEQAFEDAELHPSRFIDDGVLTKNIGWTLYSDKTGEKQQISCDGSWLDEDEDEEELDESNSTISKIKISEARRNPLGVVDDKGTTIRDYGRERKYPDEIYYLIECIRKAASDLYEDTVDDLVAIEAYEAPWVMSDLIYHLTLAQFKKRYPELYKHTNFYGEFEDIKNLSTEQQKQVDLGDIDYGDIELDWPERRKVLSDFVQTYIDKAKLPYKVECDSSEDEGFCVNDINYTGSDSTTAKQFNELKDDLLQDVYEGISAYGANFVDSEHIKRSENNQDSLLNKGRNAYHYLDNYITELNQKKDQKANLEKELKRTKNYAKAKDIKQKIDTLQDKIEFLQKSIDEEKASLRAGVKNKKESKEIKNESKNTVSSALNDLNASSFVELKDHIEKLFNDEIIDDDQYDEFIDIIDEEENKCEDYLRRRSKVTNTDWKDELAIENDYVVSAIQNMIQSKVVKESKKVESVDLYDIIKIGSKFNDGKYEIEIKDIEFRNIYKDGFHITVTCEIKNDKEHRIETFNEKDFLTFLNLDKTKLIKESKKYESIDAETTLFELVQERIDNYSDETIKELRLDELDDEDINSIVSRILGRQDFEYLVMDEIEDFAKNKFATDKEEESKDMCTTCQKDEEWEELKEACDKKEEEDAVEEYTFEEIVTEMENAETYDDLYEALNKIVDAGLREEAIRWTEQCEQDGDEVDVAYSIVTTDLLDDKVMAEEKNI